MPFVSAAQRRKFYATPSLRKYIPEFEAATRGPLPDRVGGQPPKRRRHVKRHQRHGIAATLARRHR